MIKSGKKRALLFALEILILLLFVGALYLYGQIDQKMEQIETPPVEFEEAAIEINPEAPTMSGYTTYALFGVDSRKNNEALAGENTDTIIIASINNETKKIKLLSIYRDALLDIGNGTYAKANSAYMLGGPEKAISMLNKNLDLQITDYATVDFSVVTEIVDYFGGLDIPLSYAEIVHMNNYCKETAEETGKSYTPVELPAEEPEDIEATLGTYHLNGVQVTSYCRIRYTASMDMGRTERQRRVIEMLVKEAIKSGLTGIFDLMDTVFPMVETSLNKTQILKMVPTLIGYSMAGSMGFPDKYNFADIDGQSYIVAQTLTDNVIDVHKFLYGKKVEYTPSPEVTAASAGILYTVEQANARAAEEAAAAPWEQESYSSYSDDSYYDDSYYDDSYYDDSYYDNSYYDDGYYDNSYDSSYEDSYDSGYSDGDYSEESYESYSDGGYEESYDYGY